MQMRCARRLKNALWTQTELVRFSNPDGGAFYDEVLDAIDATPTIDPNIQCPVTHWMAFPMV